MILFDPHDRASFNRMLDELQRRFALDRSSLEVRHRIVWLINQATENRIAWAQVASQPEPCATPGQLLVHLEPSPLMRGLFKLLGAGKPISHQALDELLTDCGVTRRPL